MEQDNIAKTIKEIRTKSKLSQSDFAKKYGVTYQAVSKWENGKNIPDITILKQICSDYNYSLDEILTGKKNYIKLILIIISVILAFIFFICFIISKNKNESFEFKTLSSLSKEFSLTGSIAYNDDKMSIYISDIAYKGKDKTEYKEIKSILYEIDNKTKTEISTYNKEFVITLDNFFKDITFNIDNHARTCEEYTKESLLLEVSAVNKNNKITKYEIPIEVSDNCKK